LPYRGANMTGYRRRPLAPLLRLLLALALGLLTSAGLTACGDEGDPAAKVVVPEFQLGTVVVLDEGSDDRTELRWTPQVGDAARFEVAIAIDTVIELRGQTSEAPIGPALVTFDTSVSEVGAGGEITTVYTVTAAGVPDGSDPGLDDAMGQLVGVIVTETVSATGLPVDSQLTTPVSLSAAAQSQLDRFVRQLSGVFVPLPSEAVGAGAVWVYASAASIAEVEWIRSTRYTLAAGALLSLELELADYATFQEIDTLGPTNLAGTVTGTGALEAELTDLAPRDGASRTELDVAIFTEETRTGRTANRTEMTLTSVDSLS
jgi:hypothetical protein